jgi:FMN phosphatase YigB (HAD superfamily)
VRVLGALLNDRRVDLTRGHESNRLAPTRALALPYGALAATLNRSPPSGNEFCPIEQDVAPHTKMIRGRRLEPSPPQPIDWDSVEIVSWDLDGTLYALPPMVQAFKRNILRDLSIGSFWATTRAVFSLWRRLSLMRRVRKRGGIEGLPTPAKHSSVKAQMIRWHSEAVATVGPQPGVVELLNAINETGRRQIVVTDYEANEKLDALALPVNFEQVFEGEVLGAIKPSPVIFEVILQRLKLAPHALLHIGDRDESDGIAARSAGCQVAILAKDFSDFPELHRRLLGGG